MDIQVSCDEFKRFLKKCYTGGLVKDLVVQASEEKGLVARFSTKERSFYAEVYLKGVKVSEEGVIKIPHVKKLMEVISRSDSNMIRIKSNDDVFVITDGSAVGKMKADMLQVDAASTIDSYREIQNLGKMFDTEKLIHIMPGIEYKNGVKIPCGMISEVLKDAKAFGYEVYNFVATKNKENKYQLKCIIVNEHTTEKHQRVIAETDFIGDISGVNNIKVGKGFREIMDGVLGEEKETIDIYFDELSLLITDNSSFYFNLHTLDDNN